MPACAQFLQTDLLTYQLPDPQHELIIISTPRGLFIAQAPQRITAFADFDPEQLTVKNSTSLFIAYADKSQVPERLILPGEGNQFRIKGTFSVQLSEFVRIGVGMNTPGVPYISVAAIQPGHEAVIGFLGRQVVVNLAGRQALDMLEADPLPRKFPGVISPYFVHPDNRLYLEERAVRPKSALGLLAPQENDCMLPQTLLIPRPAFEKLKLLGPEQQSASLKRYSAEDKRNLTLSSFITFNLTTTEIVGIQLDSGSLNSIVPDQIGEKRICTYEPVVFDKH